MNHIEFDTISQKYLYNMNFLNPSKHLHHIYPDIEGELCSRHSTTLARLKKKFTHIYTCQPQYCVISNGVAQLCHHAVPQIKISMALENGILLYYRTTQPQEKIYINTNKTEDQIILDCKGTVVEGEMDSFTSKISEVFQLATEDLSLTKVHGGIFYFHSTLPSGCFQEEEAWLSGFFLALLQSNCLLEVYSIQEIVSKMTNSKLMGKQDQIQERLFYHQNRKLCVRIGDQIRHLGVPRNVKLIFYAVGEGSTCWKEVSQENVGELEETDQQNVGGHKIYQQIYEEISKCQNGQDFNKLLTKIQALNNCYSPVKNQLPQIIQLLQKDKIDSLVSIYGSTNHLMLSTKSKIYTDLIHELKKGNPSKSRRDILEGGKWGKQVPIAQPIFSGLPSCGIAILDPSDEIWFND